MRRTASGRAPTWSDDKTIVYVDGNRILCVRSRSLTTFDPEPPQVVASGINRTWRGTTLDRRMLVSPGTLAPAPSITLGWLFWFALGVGVVLILTDPKVERRSSLRSVSYFW